MRNTSYRITGNKSDLMKLMVKLKNKGMKELLSCAYRGDDQYGGLNHVHLSKNNNFWACTKEIKSNDGDQVTIEEAEKILEL